MEEQTYILKESDYKRLLRTLSLYEKKLKEINEICTDYAQFNPNYERIRKISEI